MSINSIVNGGFETSTFPPWTPFAATITSLHSHSGSFAAELEGGQSNSNIMQLIPVVPRHRYEFIISLSKGNPCPSPSISISIAFYSGNFAYLGQGLTMIMLDNSLSNICYKAWTKIYTTTEPAPPGTVQAIVFIGTVPQVGTSNVLVDDVSLLPAKRDYGPIGPCY